MAITEQQYEELIAAWEGRHAALQREAEELAAAIKVARHELARIQTPRVLPVTDRAVAPSKPPRVSPPQTREEQIIELLKSVGEPMSVPQMVKVSGIRTNVIQGALKRVRKKPGSSEIVAYPSHRWGLKEWRMAQEKTPPPDATGTGGAHEAATAL